MRSTEIKKCELSRWSRSWWGTFTFWINHENHGLPKSPVGKVFLILIHVLTPTFPPFSDDAEVQRQEMVPVLIGDREGAELHGHNCHLPLAHLDSTLTPPPIRLSIHLSLQAFFTWTLGIFFPSTMLNTVLTSVLGWSWGGDRGEGQPQREQINCVFFLSFLVSLFISVQPLLQGSQLAHTPGDSSFSFAKMSFTVVSTPSPLGPVFKPTNTAEKRQIFNEETDYKKFLKCKKKGK